LGELDLLALRFNLGNVLELEVHDGACGVLLEVAVELPLEFDKELVAETFYRLENFAEGTDVSGVDHECVV
jgi:hypothetical protein